MVGFENENGFDFNVTIRSLIYNRNTQQLGLHAGSAITYDSVPEKEYLECLKRQKKGQGGLNLFFASVDIEKCYDNINQKYLYDIAKRCIAQDDYLIQQVSLLCKHGSKDSCQRRIKRVVGPPTGHKVYHGPTNLADRCTNTVFDSRACHVASRRELCAI